MAEPKKPRKTKDAPPPVSKDIAETQEARKRPGPPSTVRTDIDDVCGWIESGESLTAIARDRLRVSVHTLTRWIAADPTRSARVRASREASAAVLEELAEEEIANAQDPFQLARAKELAHHRRWKASKINPRQFGDKIEIEQKVTLQNLSDETLLKQLNDLGVVMPSIGAEGS